MGRGVNNPPVGELGGGGDENVPQQLRWLHSSEYTESQQIVHFKWADCMGCALYLNKAVQKREKKYPLERNRFGDRESARSGVAAGEERDSCHSLGLGLGECPLVSGAEGTAAFGYWRGVRDVHVRGVPVTSVSPG